MTDAISAAIPVRTKSQVGKLDLTMEDRKLPPYVEYHPDGASVTLVQGGSAPLQPPPNRARKCRCTAMGLLQVAATVLLLTTVAALALFFLWRGEPTPNAEYLKITALPDVANFTLVVADNHYITMTWDKPPTSIDFYLLDVTGGSGYENDSLRNQRPGTCSNGTFIRAEQTQVTCGPFDACSNLSATIRTYTTGPPERTSLGTTLKELFISGEGPSEPKSITVVAKSPSMTRLLWEPPTRIHGLVDVYKVKVCEMFSECDQKQNLSDCIEHEVTDTWLDFDSTEDTPYCVQITASARCGDKVLTSLPAIQEVRTPLFSLPDVSNLRLISAKSGHITLSWQRPKGRFDYYSVEVTEDKLSNPDTAKHWLGLCANGTIIRPDQTVLTCGPLEPCRNLSCTMRTHLSGPPERSSTGVTLTGIFIPAEDQNPPTNLTIFPESPSRTRLQWEQPEKVSGIMESYNLKICSTFESCDRAEGLSNCAEYLTTETWTAFDSSADTSYCVLVIVKTRCSFDEVSSRPLIAEIRTPLFGLPDATNLRLLSAVDNSITVAWERPQARFDYYWVSIAHDDQGDGSTQREHVESCGNGTIIHPNQTRVTCPNLEACTKVSVTLLVHRNGPPERTSRGVTLQGIFIPGEDPDPPKNITMVGKSPSLTRLQWEASAKVYGRFLAYTVKICDTFKYCGGEANMSGCIELQAHETWLDFHSSADTKYCVLVTTSSQCGERVLHSRAAVAEIRTPLFDPSEPKNITIVAKSPSVTRLQWEPARSVHGILDVYKVRVCKEFTICDQNASTDGCIEQGTSDAWLDFESTEDTPYCALITASARCGVDVLTSPPATMEVRTPLFGLPDVTNLTLISAMNNSITVAWERPNARFDYYWVTITDNKGGGHNNAQRDSSGSCGNGTIIHPDQTQVTCTSLEACTKVNVSVRTHRNGPPERTSIGVALQDIFVPAAEPDSPKNITTVGKSSSLTRLQWDPPARVLGRFIAYAVKICDTFKSCGTQESMSGCTELQTESNDAGLDFHSRVDTKYCVLVAVKAQCGELILSGLPAVAEIWTPLLDLPDVTKLSLLSAGNNSITIAWERPKTRFDYYWIYVISDESKKNDSVQTNRVGSCANGTIIHSAETRVTCTNLEACTKVSVSVRTHRSGQPEYTSHGVSLKGIFIPGEGTDPPKGITMVGKSPSLTRLQWEPPAKLSGTFRGYIVKICDSFKFCGRETNTNGCIKFQTYDTWLDFNSSADTNYCVLVTTSTQCGEQALNGRPVVAEIRTPLLVAPDVTKLRLVTVGTDFFTAAWEKPKGRFDYYSVEVIRGDHYPWFRRTVMVGSCASGTIIHPDKTQVTCNQLPFCSKVGFKVRTHINGPPSRTSLGITINEILIRETVPPEVTDMKLGAVTADNFVLTWQRPKPCFDYYTVEVTDENSGAPIDLSCNKGAVINANETSVICDQTKTCTNVTIQVRTHTRGPPTRSSRGAKLTNVLMQGKVLSEVANLRLAYRGFDSFSVTFQAPKNCFDVFHYNITCSMLSNRTVKHERCTQRRLNTAWSPPNTFMITCTNVNVKACVLLDFALGTRFVGPPVRDSHGVLLRSIVSKLRWI